MYGRSSVLCCTRMEHTVDTEVCMSKFDSLSNNVDTVYNTVPKYSQYDSQDRTVIIATRLWAQKSGIQFPAKDIKTWSSPKISKLLCSPHSLIFNGPWVLYTRVWRLRKQAEHSSPSRDLIKNERRHTSASLPIWLNGVHRDNFTLQGTFANWKKWISALSYECHLSIHPHRTTQIPLDGLP